MKKNQTIQDYKNESDEIYEKQKKHLYLTIKNIIQINLLGGLLI